MYIYLSAFSISLGSFSLSDCLPYFPVFRCTTYNRWLAVIVSLCIMVIIIILWCNTLVVVGCLTVVTGACLPSCHSTFSHKISFCNYHVMLFNFSVNKGVAVACLLVACKYFVHRVFFSAYIIFRKIFGTVCRLLLILQLCAV